MNLLVGLDLSKAKKPRYNVPETSLVLTDKHMDMLLKRVGK